LIFPIVQPVQGNRIKLREYCSRFLLAETSQSNGIEGQLGAVLFIPAGAAR
jgi:hypothetical protein